MRIIKYKKYSIYNLINLISFLDNGVYRKNGISLSVSTMLKDNKHKYKTVAIETPDKKVIYEGDLNFTSDRSCHIFHDELEISFDNFSVCWDDLTLKKGDYTVYMGEISNLYGNYASKHSNILYAIVDNNTKIGYNFDDGKVYVYYKQPSNLYYTAVEYNDDFWFDIEDYNKLVDKNKRMFENGLKNESLRKHVSLLSMPKLNVDVDEAVDKLLEMVFIYQEYEDILEHEEDYIKDIYLFIEDLIKNPLEASINSLNNYIETTDLSNPEALRELNKKIRTVKKHTRGKKLQNKSLKLLKDNLYTVE